MSKPRLLLAASLICNAILIAWAALPGSSSGDSRLAQTAEPASSRLGAWFARLAPPSEAASSASSDTMRDGDYSESGWTRSLYDDVAELRERGFDDATVRMLALAEAERLFRERAQAVLAPRKRMEYWEPGRRAERIDAAQLATYHRLRREKLAVIEELVGPDVVSTERNTPYTFMAGPLMTLDYLPDDKRLALTEYLETSEVEFQASLTPLGRTRRSGAFADPARHMEHQLTRDAQIRLILGPESYEEYLRRSSETARRMRSQLTAFRPTRAEFDALVAIEHEHSMQRNQVHAFSSRGTTPQKGRVMADQHTDAIRAALGEQRYVDYERSRDHSVVMLDRLVSELQVAPEAARASFEQLEQARAKWQSLISQASAQPNREPDPRIQTDLAALQRQLRTELARTLGLEGMSENEITALLAGVEAFPQNVSR